MRTYAHASLETIEGASSEAAMTTGWTSLVCRVALQEEAGSAAASDRRTAASFPGSGHAHLVQRHPPVQPPNPARQRVINHNNLVAPDNKGINQVRTNKSSIVSHKPA
jgi:hypothetical protein